MTPGIARETAVRDGMRLCLFCATKDESRYVDLIPEAFRQPCSRCGNPTLFEMRKRVITPRKVKAPAAVVEETFEEPED